MKAKTAISVATLLFSIGYVDHTDHSTDEPTLPVKETSTKELRLPLAFSPQIYFSKIDSRQEPTIEPLTIENGIGKKYLRSYDEGIGDIATAATIHDKEDWWLFDGSVWHDFGFDGSYYGFDSEHSTTGMISMAKDIFKDSPADTIYSVHNHNRSGVGALVRLRSLFTRFNTSQPSVEVLYDPPSPTDLLTARRLQQVGKEYGKTVISQAVDPEGVWSYHWKNAEEDIWGIHETEDSKKMGAYVMSFFEFLWANDSERQKVKGHLNELDFYKDATDLGVYISFQPHKQAIK